jgi:PIN domain nuclease of toxin-antitoxin system
MTLLLDTHVLLWWLDDPEQLSRAARRAIQDGTNPVCISAAVAREIAIKNALGNLDAPDNLEDVMEANRFLPLPITIPHALAVPSLPHHHRDPFGWILIAQALYEGFRLVNRDPEIAKYPVPQIVA